MFTSATSTARLAAATAAGLGVGIIAIAMREIGDFDLPWHLAAGRQMWRARSVFVTDDLSFTYGGTPVPYEPIADLLLTLAEAWGGAAGLHGLAMILMGLMTWATVARAWSPSPLLATAMAAWALMASALWLTVRPALFSFALLAGLLYVIDRHRSRPSRLLFLWVVPLQWAWANSHGSAAFGLLLLLGFAAYVAACRALRGRLALPWFPATEGQRSGFVALTALLAAGATCLSPFGGTRRAAR
jgi:hypothetical protein